MKDRKGNQLKIGDNVFVKHHKKISVHTIINFFEQPIYTQDFAIVNIPEPCIFPWFSSDEIEKVFQNKKQEQLLILELEL